jgi:hypothetical protein
MSAAVAISFGQSGMQNTAKEIGKRFGSWKAIILNTGRPVVSAKTLTFEYLRNPELLEFLFGSGR